MGVFVEPVTVQMDGRKMSRLRADSLTELHAFVEEAGLSDVPFVENPHARALSYYELTVKQRKAAFRAGAAWIDWRETLRRAREAVVDEVRRDGAPLPEEPATPAPTPTAALIGGGSGRFIGPAPRRSGVSSFTLSKVGRSVTLTPRRPASTTVVEAPCELVSLGA